jgi:acid phosphatase
VKLQAFFPQVFSMRFSTSAVVASLASVAIASPVASPVSPTATDTADVYAAQATALTESPTSHVKGKAFDRYVSIWFENTDYDMAAADVSNFLSN